MEILGVEVQQIEKPYGVLMEEIEMFFISHLNPVNKSPLKLLSYVTRI